MACNIPIIAAQVGSMKELFDAHPEWLYAPNDADELAKVLENRLSDRRTAYKSILTWRDLAVALEEILCTVCQESR
jgi:glycosyltransferase involved in cell wall biosynthesis